MNKKTKVIIAELNPYHDECIYSQCLMLRQMDVEITVIGNCRSEKRIRASLVGVADKLVFFPFDSGWRGLKAIFQFYFLVRGMGQIYLHLNTAQGNVAWKLFMLPFPKRISITGVIHNVPKLKKSFGQKIITRQIKRYMLLSDVLLPEYKKVCSKPAVSVYPIFYPKRETVAIDKPKGQTWIVIPGAVAYGRRDFDSLLTSGIVYPKSIRFILLGNINCADGHAVLETIRHQGLESSFITFDGYVPDEVFYAYIEVCDYMMPLVHPDNPRYTKYVKEKISGTYDLAIAYRKPMLCPKEMERYEDFADTAIFYDKNNLSSFFKDLTPAKTNDNLFKLDKWTLKYQTKQLERLLFDEQ